MKTRSRRRSLRWPTMSTPIRNLTVDVGQVVFGETTSMTGDGPVGYYLSKVYKSKWFSSDTELEAGCGIVPIEYKNTSLIHAWQWAIGLEWYLMVQDPWRVVMSTDHPNGGSFLAYPQIIRLLMDRTYRQDLLKTAPRKVREQSALAGLDRAVHAVGDRHHHAGRPGSNPRPQAQGPPRPGCRRRYHDLYARREPGDHVRPAAFCDQVGPDHCRTGRNPRRKPMARRCTSHPITTRTSRPTSSAGSKNPTRSSGGIIPSTSSRSRPSSDHVSASIWNEAPVV